MGLQASSLRNGDPRPGSVFLFPQEEATEGSQEEDNTPGSLPSVSDYSLGWGQVGPSGRGVDGDGVSNGPK